MVNSRVKGDSLTPGRYLRARVEMSVNHSRGRGSTMNITTYSLDLAKRVFRVEADTGN